MKDPKKEMNRREFLRRLGFGTASAMAMMAMEPLEVFSRDKETSQKPADIRMTYRVQHGSGEQISLLGFGMMRLPDSQEEVNQLVDFAINHGVNYFDTSPMYKGGRNETQTGEALKRHPRDKWFVATKMSNYDQRYWTIDGAKSMYENSFKALQVDHIDYYLMHGIGQNGMKDFNPRFINNGLLDFLLKERDAGRIRHLGFSYHGNVEVFDWLLDHNDKYHWDFAQIQMNYVDWRHASLKRGWNKDADAEYLYNKLDKLGIQCVIMEPLRGGALGRLPDELSNQLKAVRPDDSMARWAFRWVGSRPNVLTTLSGMNNTDHLKENVLTFSPLETCTEAENMLLANIADQMAGFPTIPCTTCRYCMPCPYGVDIPGNFAYYNEAVHNHILPLPEKDAADYKERLQAFNDGLIKALPDEKTWAHSCMDCEECLSKCPQQIRIPNQLARIVETLRG